MDILAGPSSHPTAAPRLTGAPLARRETPTALQVRWARDADDVQAAQRLRHAVFAGEMGAQLDLPPGTPPGLDVDRFDAFCEHLIVCTAETDSRPGEVVGTYRVLTPDGARMFGDATGANVGRGLAIVLDGKVYIAASFVTGGDDPSLHSRLTSHFTPAGAPE